MTEVPIPHRREFSRVQVSPVIDLTVNGVPMAGVEVGNLSLRGLLLVSNARPEPESPCTIAIRLGGTAAEVRAIGRVIRTTENGFAVRFTEIMGLDSLEHLRNLIRYNSQNPDQVEQEFRTHLGLKTDV